MKPKFELIPSYEIPLTAQCSIFNQAFKNYLAGWAEMDAPTLAHFISVQGADPGYSRFVTLDGKPAGFGYISRTGNISRLSGMGTIPEARRQGAAAWLLDRLVEEAGARNDEAMILEVFEQNTAALDLYQKKGFGTLMRLFGWRRAPRPVDSADAPAPLEEISPILASQLPSACDYPAIPWQVSRYAIAKLPIAHAFRAGPACVVIGDPAAPTIRIHACFSATADLSAERTLLAAVLGRFSKSEFFAPAIFPERQGPQIFEPLGFTRDPLNQFLMRKDL